MEINLIFRNSKKIIKTYIIGNYMKTFKNYLQNKVKIQSSGTLKNAIISNLKDIQNIKEKKLQFY